MPRRLVIDARMFASSGIGTVSQNVLPRVLAALPQVEVLLLGEPTQLQRLVTRENITILRFAARVYSIEEQFAWLGLPIRPTDLIWATHYNIPLFKLNRLVCTVYDLAHLALPEVFGRGLRRLYARFMFQRVAARARAIFCISQFTADEMHRFTGASRDRLVVTPLAFEETAEAGAPMQSLAARPVEPPYFLYVGNVKAHKNLPRLLDAFSRLLNQMPHVLLIVGKKDGFITGDTAALALAERLGDRVRFTGHLDNDALRACYQHAHALVQPSLYEGFGLPPLEAMARDCPVLSARAGSLPEVCGDAALYFDPRDVDAIAQALLTAVRWAPEERAGWVERGRQRVPLFSWDRCAAITREHLEPLLE